ncbi:hypothetical protein, partial [Sansalvadorimonas verongulae]|uniref:hypothetical protein n=1 Tax=Sansalvadorimonas verongulae TaxID=2172824 RepID=UPI0018AD2389
MSMTYRLNIHPFEEGTLQRGVFKREDIRADSEGKIRETIRVVDFYEAGSVDYTVVLSSESSSGTPVEIKRFHLRIAALKESQARQFRGESGVERTGSDTPWLEGEHKKAIIIDLSDIPMTDGAVVEQDKFQAFLRSMAHKTLKSGINLLVTPDDKTIEGLKALKDCVIVSKERYRSTIQPILQGLNEQEDWALGIINYDLFDSQLSDTDLVKLAPPFSKASMDDDTIVRRVDEPVFRSGITEEGVSLPAQSMM